MIKTESLQILTSRSRLGSYNDLCKKFLKYFIRIILKRQFPINCNQKRSLKSRSVIRVVTISRISLIFSASQKDAKANCFINMTSFIKSVVTGFFVEKKIEYAENNP